MAHSGCEEKERLLLAYDRASTELSDAVATLRKHEGVTGKDEYEALCRALSAIAAALIEKYFGTFARIGEMGFKRAVFLGSGSRVGAAREAALKMAEMTAGGVTSIWESYLGLRHGPMSCVHRDTLIVCFLSSDKNLRAYEADLLRELDQKHLGLLKVVVGERVPQNVLREGDVAIECPGLTEVGDENAPVIDVIAGQLLGFFRCIQDGLRPDSPSRDGVISRVVQSFTLHLDANGEAGILRSREMLGPRSQVFTAQKQHSAPP